MACFVLVPSPLFGPSTWAPLGSELIAQGARVLIATPVDAGVPPFWPQHAAAAAITVPEVDDLVLVGHGGAGPLLPAIADAAGRPVARYVFADADLPHHGMSRLDLLKMRDPAFAAAVDQGLQAGGSYPEWSDDDLAGAIPSRFARAAVLSELKPRSRAFFVEPLPVPPGWPDAPCAYLQLSAEYDVVAGEARRHGWPVEHLDGGHFRAVADPPAVAAALLRLADVR